MRSGSPAKGAGFAGNAKNVLIGEKLREEMERMEIGWESGSGGVGETEGRDAGRLKGEAARENRRKFFLTQLVGELGYFPCDIKKSIYKVLY